MPFLPNGIPQVRNGAPNLSNGMPNQSQRMASSIPMPHEQANMAPTALLQGAPSNRPKKIGRPTIHADGVPLTNAEKKERQRAEKKAKKTSRVGGTHGECDAARGNRGPYTIPRIE